MCIYIHFFFPVHFMYWKEHYWLEDLLGKSSLLSILSNSYLYPLYIKKNKTKRKLMRNKLWIIVEPLYSIKLTKYMCLSLLGDEKKKKKAYTYSQTLLQLGESFSWSQELLWYTAIWIINEERIQLKHMVIKLFGMQSPFMLFNITENAKNFSLCGLNLSAYIYTTLEIKTKKN